MSETCSSGAEDVMALGFSAFSFSSNMRTELKFVSLVM